MRNGAAVSVGWAGQRHRHVTALSPVQVHVISLLGYASAIYVLPHRNSG
jgi:hypothetical protein